MKLASSHVKVLNICLLHQLRASTETSRGGEDLAKGNKGEDRWVRPCALCGAWAMKNDNGVKGRELFEKRNEKRKTGQMLVRVQ
ncbi:unnamed protein product [Fusarium graminearum]|uniref:Chromosome 4, complete genome n=1 Tax=Gibberella zeae (strain ATCC MYA-4620 / CBS 123657 / FGSC 9075 / NRRL 31084 / PH-1) TaxID=229533 RepID=A0A098DSM8_GIBZE|nr:unnamed protein product [Fusarium graminearum]CZS74062.1 unnamed protein product [Fusarium graminearum]